MKTEMYIESISPYFGRHLYRAAKLTKRQLVTEPPNEIGARMRFYRPCAEALSDGMPLTLFPKGGYDSSTYFLRLKRED